MPTGYTAIIEDGATFEQFVWRCARSANRCRCPSNSLRAPADDEP